MDDRQLLRQFVEENSQEAFASLTKRYLGLVYSVCRRELDDAETAEDVTQAVFLILARKAPTLRRTVVLSGWLFQTARFAAKNARLQAQRRAAHEQKAAEAMQQQSEGREDAAWAEIEPLLNPALAALREADHQCVLLRFFQEMTFAEAGAALGLSEEAARKRVTRALEKMRKFFEKGGVIAPGATLAALLSAHAAKAVPATCQANTAAITNGVLARYLPLSLTGSHVYQLSEGALKAMKIVQLKIATSVALAVLLGVSTTYAVARNTALKAERSVALKVQAQAIPAHWGGTDIRRPMRTLDQMQNYLTVQVYQVDQKINDRFNRGEFTEEERQRRIHLANEVFVSARDKAVDSNYTIPFDEQTVSHDLEQVVQNGVAPAR